MEAVKGSVGQHFTTLTSFRTHDASARYASARIPKLLTPTGMRAPFYPDPILRLRM